MFASIFPQDEDYPLSPPPSWFQLVLSAICIFSILLPAGITRLSSGALIFSLMFYLVVWTRAPTNDAYMAGTNGTMIFFRWLDLIAIHKPERDFWRTGQTTEGEKVDGHAPPGLWGKVKWYFDLSNSQRGIGWNIEPANLPSLPKDYPKGLFIKETAIRTARLYLSLDIMQNTLKYSFAGHQEPFFDFPLHLQLFITWISALAGYHGIEWAYSMGALITVIPGLCKPSDWPAISGNFRRDAWSVRKLWGTCWHQMMRRPCTEAGRIVKEIFGFKKGTFMSRYSQLWMAFIVSTAVHHTAALTGCFEDMGLTQAIYFMVQPVGIMFEDGVIGLGKVMGWKQSVWTKRLGFVWVFLWFTFWIRYMLSGWPRSRSQTLEIPSIVEYLSTLVHKYWVEK